MASSAQTRLFKSNRSQAVRIPKALAFGDDVREVTITREGDRLVVEPRRGGKMDWNAFMSSPDAADYPTREAENGPQREIDLD